MHLLKPSWLIHSDEHQRSEIYTVCLNPDGTRLASGGLDGKIRLWSTESIYKTISSDSLDESTTPQSRELSILTTETGAITVLRFSPCGQYLASGSDDGVVRIWKKNDSTNVTNSQGQASTENWVVHKKLIADAKEVQDLGWAPDSKLIVSVGLNGSIIIWSGTTFEKLKKFDAHKLHVKGVAFDPANQYFATASDDRTVKIIRYEHISNAEVKFSIESTISNPFKGSPLSTYYRRCSWSPDGNHIAAANATNGPVTTVTIINRGTWDSDISLVGHDAPCEVASFCPRIFSLDKSSIDGNNTAQAGNLITVIATAGQDKTLAIWNTSNPRPLLVACNVAEKSITDIAWSPDGSRLFACSLDGTIVVAIFEEGELGWVVPLEENENQLTRYGGGKYGRQNSAESPIVVDDEEDTAKTDPKPASGLLSILNAPDENSLKDTNELASTNSVPNLASSHDITEGSIKPVTKPKTGSTKLPTQKVTITKEGKTRITPILLSSNSYNEPSSAVFSHSSEESDKAKNTLIETSEPSLGLPPGGIAAMAVRSKRKGSDDNENGHGENKRSRHENESQYIRPALLSFSSDLSRVRLSVPKVRIFFTKGSPEEKDNFVLEIRNSANNDTEPTTVLISTNGSVIFRDFLPKYGHLATGRGNTFWAVATEDGTIYVYSPSGRRLIPGIILGCPLAFLESQGQYLMAVTCTGLLHLWDISTTTAIYSAVSIAPLLDNELNSSEDALVKGPGITQCGVTSKGKAIITLTNGDGFIYNDQMLAWLRISEAWWAFGSQYWGSTHTDKARAQSRIKPSEDGSSSVMPSSTTGIISLIEHRTNQETMIKAGGRGKYLQRIAKNRMLKEGYENFERCISTAHLENRVSAAIMAESGEELQTFLKMYAIRLAAEGMSKRLEELCNELLGPTVTIPKNSDPQNKKIQGDLSVSGKWLPSICGLDKHELLRDVILAVGKYREIQGVIVKYATVVGVLDRINAM